LHEPAIFGPALLSHTVPGRFYAPSGTAFSLSADAPARSISSAATPPATFGDKVLNFPCPVVSLDFD
jgi:hypothetical protein